MMIHQELFPSLFREQLFQFPKSILITSFHFMQPVQNGAGFEFSAVFTKKSHFAPCNSVTVML